MKPSRFFILISFLLIAFVAQADDVDLYGISESGEGLKPNVLILLDNSGSMREDDVPADPYDPSQTYSGDYSSDSVYVEELVAVEKTQRVCSWRRCWDKTYIAYEKQWVLFHNDIAVNWDCSEAKSALESQGTWSGVLAGPDMDDPNSLKRCSDSGTPKDYRLGNYFNFTEVPQTLRNRMAVAKEVVANLIYENHGNVNFGLMIFNTEGSNTDRFSDYVGNGGYIIAECGASQDALIGHFEPGDTMTRTSQSGYGAVGLVTNETNTPISEALLEAGLYFAGEQSWYNGRYTGSSYPVGKYSKTCTDYNNSCKNYSDDSPIEWRCQKNYIILVTDGEPTKDNGFDYDADDGDWSYDSRKDKLRSYDYINGSRISDTGETSYLDDVAEFLNSNDLRPDMGSAGDFPDQTVVTYTVGFQTDQSLLQSAATRGGGQYYTATSAAELGESLTNIISRINVQNVMFAPASVPVSADNGIYAGDAIYLGMFKPTSEFWPGNLKKYGLEEDGYTLKIVGKNGNLATSEKGIFFENATSYWGTAADGRQVDAGGAGQILRDRSADRVLYTYTGNNIALSDASNLFNPSNTNLTSMPDDDPPGFGLSVDEIDAVHRGVAEDWPLGSVLHFKPWVEHYDTDNDGDNDKSVIFLGANDGLLHCFDDSTGEELWGFVPPNLLPYIKTLDKTRDDPPFPYRYFVDGQAHVYRYDDGNENTPDKKLLLFGQRRGGTRGPDETVASYFALDVTDFNNPQFKYRIDKNTLGLSLGQTWSEPQLCRMAYVDDSSSKTKDVFLMIGGYDNNQDLEGEEKASEDSVGRSVFAIDAQTGALFSNCLFNHENYAAMTHSIIGATAYPNPLTGNSTRIYAGDLNGNLFAFRDDIYHHNQDKNQRSEFEDKYDGQEDGIWEQKLKLHSIPEGYGRKVFVSPRAVQEFFPVEIEYPGNETLIERRVGDYVFFGTGDRAKPRDISSVNSLYALKNNWQWSSDSPTIIEAYIDESAGGKIKAISDNHEIDDSELFILDVTEDRIQNQEEDSTFQQEVSRYVRQALIKSNNRGWFIRFVEPDGSNIGEMLTARPLVRNGVVFFTTFIPPDDSDGSYSEDDPCDSPSNFGTSRIWAIDYQTGAAVYNFDITNDVEDETGTEGNKEILARTDRYKTLASGGIAPEPTFVSTAKADYVMVGTELVPEATDKHPAKSMFWRQLNRD